MERKIGEIFTYKGKTYQVVKSIACIDCTFRERVCSLLKSYTGPCNSNIRSDKTSVIFKEINNMENNQLTINIPEGMEIDIKNSDLTKGIIRFKRKWLTLEQIYKLAKVNNHVTHRDSIKYFSDSKLVAIANLMDIARYFNGDWSYNADDEKTMGYAIYYSTHGVYHYTEVSPQARVYYGIPVFKNKDDAQYVIDNPNFRNILDAIYKN